MLKGSMVALVTPMQADGSLDWETLRKLVDWHIDKGTHAIVAVGTTGESPTLDTTGQRRHVPHRSPLYRVALPAGL